MPGARNESGHLNLFAALGNNCKRLQYRSGDVIFQQGEEANSIFYIERGAVRKSYISQSGKEGIVGILKAREFFGTGCIVGYPTRRMTAMAVTDCTVIPIKSTLMTEVVRNDRKVAEMFIAFLVDRSQQYEHALVGHLFHTCEERLARTLLQLSSLSETPGEQVPLPAMSQEKLAEIVGTTRPRINFFMNKFRQQGLIEYDGQIKVSRSRLKRMLAEQDEDMAGGYPPAANPSALPPRPPRKAPATLGDLLFAGSKVLVPERDWAKFVRSIAIGDHSALHALYEMAHRIVFTWMMRISANREAAEEMTVDVFHDVWQSASRYDAMKYTVLAWTMSLARSHAVPPIESGNAPSSGCNVQSMDILCLPTSLWTRLALRIAEENDEPPCLLPPVSRWSEPEWKDVASGIACKLLATDTERNRISMLVRLAPGGRYPAHIHAGEEELHLLHGELWIDDRKLFPGDYHHAGSGTTDEHVWSEMGCTCVLTTSTKDTLRLSVPSPQ